MVEVRRTRTPTKSNCAGSYASSGLFRVDSEAQDFEVTHEEHLERTQFGRKTSPSRECSSPQNGHAVNNSGGVAQRLSNMLLRPRKSTTTAARSSRRAVANNAGDLSLSSDRATTMSERGADGDAGLVNSNFTVASNDTIKVSNKSENPVLDDDGILCFRKRWSQFKVLVGNKTIAEEKANVPRQHSYSADYHKVSPAVRQRLKSVDDTPPKRVRSNPCSGTVNEALSKQTMVDQSIRGRLDGIDCIALGPPEPFTVLPWLAHRAPVTFTGKRLDAMSTPTPAEMISSMLWTSCGRDLPEIILEGFVPGCDDRWTVRVEERHEPSCATLFTLFKGTFRGVPGCTDGEDKSNTTTAAQEDSEELLLQPSEDGSSILPTHRLWHKLWGSETKPISATAICPVEDDDPLLSLAAEHSIPIDLDENTFCVSDRTHLDTIHTFVAVSLSMGRFQSAILILKKLLKGIDLIKEEDMRFLKGSTLHNLGMIFMWKGDYDNALEYFHNAVQERTRILPKDHPDIAVTLVRKGQAQFALGRLDDALFAMELALPMTSLEHIVRSKILNNMGVIQFVNHNLSAAMKSFTNSLEISRVWLESTIRRDAIVYDASTTLSNMGRLYVERQDFDLAYYVYEEALLLQTTSYRKGHNLVLSSLTSLALCRARQDKAKKSIQLLQGCLRSKNTRFGKESPEAIETLAMMGLLYDHLEMYDDALKCMLTVRRWQRANLPVQHPSLRKTKQIANKLEENLGKNFSIWV